MLIRAATLIALGLLTSHGGGAVATAAAVAYNPDPSAWVIGPIIRGRNYSIGMPLNPTPGRRGSWYIDLPRHPGSVHYVTFPHGSLAGKSRIVMRYRIVADPGVRIEASTAPGSPAIITLYFQRARDNWSGRRQFETYRWFATFASKTPVTPGEHVMVAPLNGAWTAIETSTARSNPAAFRDAVQNADQVGFVLGGGDGYGHGVYATGRARLIVTEFRVE